MKRSVLTAVVLISLIAIFVTTAGVANRSAVLSKIDFVDGKGVVLTFTVKGTFFDEDLKQAYITVNHTNYALHCAQQDVDHVDCEASGQVVKFHGREAKGAFAGFPYVTMIPKITHSHAK